MGWAMVQGPRLGEAELEAEGMEGLGVGVWGLGFGGWGWGLPGMERTSGRKSAAIPKGRPTYQVKPRMVRQMGWDESRKLSLPELGDR